MAELRPRLPRGRHGMSREEVEEAQRLRILVGMAEAMQERGYVGTSVAHVIKRAGVSRETFYQLYRDKLDCFLAAFDLVGDVLAGHLTAALDGDGAPLEQFERALSAYLELMASEPAYARLFLVEVHAAGPEAMAKRAALQERIVDAIAELFGVEGEEPRFACQVVVAAVSSMVTGPLVRGDLEALRELDLPLRGLVARLVAAGVI